MVRIYGYDLLKLSLIRLIHFKLNLYLLCFYTYFMLINLCLIRNKNYFVLFFFTLNSSFAYVHVKINYCFYYNIKIRLLMKYDL